MPKKQTSGWTDAVVQVVQHQKYRGAVGLITFGLLAIAAVLGIVAYRADNPWIVAVVSGIVALGFFGAIVMSIKYLGPFALLDASQIATALKMSAKNTDPISFQGPPVLGSGSTDSSPEIEGPKQ